MMPKLDIYVSHRLSQEEALRRIKHLLGDVKAKFADKITNLHEEWSGNGGEFSFSAMGFHVSGTLTVSPSAVRLTCDLPLAALLFKTKIEAAIMERARELLA